MRVFAVVNRGALRFVKVVLRCGEFDDHREASAVEARFELHSSVEVVRDAIDDRQSGSAANQVVIFNEENFYGHVTSPCFGGTGNIYAGNSDFALFVIVCEWSACRCALLRRA